MTAVGQRRVGTAALLGLLLSAGLAGCTQRALPPPPRADQASVRQVTPPLGAYFDCLRERGQTLISAHRAGPAPGLPENALETMAATLDANRHALLEIDVARSRDGVLFLLHDDRLDRTTTGTGLAASRSWAALSRLRLRDPNGAVTGSRLPTLADALALAVRRGAVVTLDLKRGVPLGAVVDAVRAAGAVGHAVIITYDAPSAIAAAKVAPDLMISASIDGPADWDALRQGGVPDAQLLAWTGTTVPDPDLIATLREGRIEPMFGTLGAPGRRLDDRYMADGDPSEYGALSRLGVVVIGTDQPAAAATVMPRVTCRR